MIFVLIDVKLLIKIFNEPSKAVSLYNESSYSCCTLWFFPFNDFYGCSIHFNYNIEFQNNKNATTCSFAGKKLDL